MNCLFVLGLFCGLVSIIWLRIDGCEDVWGFFGVWLGVYGVVWRLAFVGLFGVGLSDSWGLTFGWLIWLLVGSVVVVLGWGWVGRFSIQWWFVCSLVASVSITFLRFFSAFSLPISAL